MHHTYRLNPSPSSLQERQESEKSTDVKLQSSPHPPLSHSRDGSDNGCLIDCAEEVLILRFLSRSFVRCPNGLDSVCCLAPLPRTCCGGVFWVGVTWDERTSGGLLEVGIVVGGWMDGTVRCQLVVYGG